MATSDLRLTSLQNDQVKNLVRLRNRRERDRQNLTIIEEPLVIARALASGYPLTTVYYCREIMNATHEPLLNELRQQAQAIAVTSPVMAKISYRSRPEGLLVVAPQRHLALSHLIGRSQAPPLLIVLEGVEKPGNLGAVLRVADAAGADGVISCGQGTDIFNPNVLRASRGAFFHVPTVQCSRDELLVFLKEQNIRTTAASPAGEQTWDQHDFRGPEAILLGTEHEGLSSDLLACADCRISLPMRGLGDSLNVSATAAILLYEALRQRQA